MLPVQKKINEKKKLLFKGAVFEGQLVAAGTKTKSLSAKNQFSRYNAP